jgi:hypothetical protein
MAKLALTIKLNGAPNLVVTHEVKKLGDVRGMLRKADRTLTAACRTWRELPAHNVESVTIRPE